MFFSKRQFQPPMLVSFLAALSQILCGPWIHTARRIPYGSIGQEVLVSTELNVAMSLPAGLRTKFFLSIAKPTRESSMELRAERMIIRSLTQHRKAFEAIYLDHKDELNRFITSWRGIGYIAVSTKAFIDGEISRTREWRQFHLGRGSCSS
jgi:hypothetical protein